MRSELQGHRNKENLASDDNRSSTSDVKRSLANNRERNREGNTEENRERDRSNIRSAPPSRKGGGTRGRGRAGASATPIEASPPQGTQQPGEARASEAAELAAVRLGLVGFIEDLRRELNDQATAGATLARAVNLYRRSGLSLEEFHALLYDARRLTQQHTGAIRAQRVDRGTGGIAVKPKMAYFFGVLQNALGLDGADTSGGADPEPPGEPPSPEAPADPAPTPQAGAERDFVEAVANAAMSRNISWRLARQLARENAHLLADWLDHGGTWTLARDPGKALAELIRAGERPPQTRISGD